MSRRKGFTLIELIAVLVIIAISAAIVIPNYIAYMNNAETTKTVQNNLIAIYDAQKNYYLNNGKYCTDSCNNLADINTNLSLNIIDNDLTNYSCSSGAGPSIFSCMAMAQSNNDALGMSGGQGGSPVPIVSNMLSKPTLTITNAPIVLPGGTGCPGAGCNPSCSPPNSINCPS